MTKTIAITGATDGIGFETAKLLAAEGHSLLLHDGALTDNGMAGFEGSMTKEEVEAVRAYVIHRANQDKALGG